MAEHPNADLIRRLYASTGPPEAVAHLFRKDAVWHLPGEQPLSGDHIGRDAIVTAMRNFMGIQLEVLDVIANEVNAVALLRARSERKGRTYEAFEVDVFRILDGEIAEFWSFSDDQRKTDAFWS